MDGLMTKVANHEGLSSTRSHGFDPAWSFSSLSFEICKLANMVHFYILP
jgi:hypothetical protein